jgi:hypothetical protein
MKPPEGICGEARFHVGLCARCRELKAFGCRRFNSRFDLVPVARSLVRRPAVAARPLHSAAAEI